MRYLVRYVKDNEIINDLFTDNEGEAFEREYQLRQKYGRENVWTVDAIMEILAG